MEILPRRLTNEEEKKCINLLYTEKHNKAREVLINHNLRLVSFVISQKFSNVNMEFDDLFSTGTIGLIKGVDTYKKETKFKLATYLATCIKNEILMALRKHLYQQKNVQISLDDRFYTKDDEVCLSEVVPDKKDYIEEADKKMDIAKTMSKVKNALSKQRDIEQKVLNQYFGINGEEKVQQKQIAENVGISQSYVSRVKDRAIRKLSEELSITK